MKAPDTNRRAGHWPSAPRATLIDVEGLLRRDRVRSRASSKRARKAARGPAASIYSQANGAGGLVRPTHASGTGGYFSRPLPEEVKVARDAKSIGLARGARVAASARDGKAASAQANIGPATRAAMRRKAGAR